MKYEKSAINYSGESMSTIAVRINKKLLASSPDEYVIVLQSEHDDKLNAFYYRGDMSMFLNVISKVFVEVWPCVCF